MSPDLMFAIGLVVGIFGFFATLIALGALWAGRKEDDRDLRLAQERAAREALRPSTGLIDPSVQDLEHQKAVDFLCALHAIDTAFAESDTAAWDRALGDGRN